MRDGERNIMDEQSKNQTSTDPSTVSIPPAEGRTDIGEGQGGSQQLRPDQVANATTSPTDQLLSKQPAEGRADVAQKPAQEQEQSYSKIGRAHVELQSHSDLVCRLLLEKKKKQEK